MKVGLDEFIKRVTTFKDKEKDRKYEVWISEIAKTVNDNLLEDFYKYAEDDGNPLFERKSCFFVVFTYYRKNFLLSEMNNLIQTFKQKPAFDFVNDPILFHIELLYSVKSSNSSDYEELLMRFEDKLNSSSSKDYQNFIGFLNHYVELCASYYEIHLEKRYNNNNIIECERLNNALQYSKTCCCEDSTYSKLFVNKGRIFALLGKYADAEQTIKHGIDILEDDSYRKTNLISYTSYLDKVTSIVAFDNSYKTIKECERKQDKISEEISKSKVENVKNLSIISAFLSFLLGGIQAFAKIEDYKVIGLVMLMYSGIIFCMIGLVNLITSLFMFKIKDKPAPIIVSSIVIIVGILLFTVGFIIKV